MAGDATQLNPENGRRFAAFISYSHADAVAAAKLQKKLERYQLPKHIVAEQARDAAGLGRIFRDREDLAAAASLSDAIRAAIANAEALIVLCSPDAAASTWVSAEISLFRELHPDRPVLAALVRGEPANAFPPALTENGCEPLAADLRPGGDGASLGFLKIVAGIAGVPLDMLIQRDAQRRIRRVTAITVVTSILVLAMGIMTAFAIQARNEAARQRASAEGLVEYMLTDLRTKLLGVGRLNIMESVNERALQYYSAQGELENLGEDSLLRRAQIIGRMGEDDEGRGNLDAAEKKFLEADRLAAALYRKRPDVDDRVFAYAKSHNRLALLAQTRSRWPEALRGFTFSSALIEQLLTQKAPKPEWVRLGAYVNGNICASYLTLKKSPEAALSHCKRAINLNEHVIRLLPDDKQAVYDLVFHLVWYDEALAENGDVGAALAASTRSLFLIDGLRKGDPQNMLWREQEMQVRVRIADRIGPTGDQRARAEHWKTARKINASLLAIEPNNAGWRRYRTRLSID